MADTPSTITPDTTVSSQTRNLRALLQLLYDRLTITTDGSLKVTGIAGGGGGGGTGDASNGAAITGQSLETGGSYLLGWLSSVRKAITDRLGTLGQKTMAGSTPVTIASDQSAVPVSGTFYQATQPVSAAVLPLPTGAAAEHTTAASFHAVRQTDGTSFYKPTTPSDTQPVSAVNLPLPSGAATSAKQPALGTAGSASADVLTVQGAAGGTAIPISGTVSIGSQAPNSLVTTARTTLVTATATASGDTSLVAASASQTIRVWRVIVQVNTGPVGIKLRSGTTDLHPAKTYQTGGGFILDFSAEPWYVTTANQALQINLSTTGSVVVEVWYTQS